MNWDFREARRATVHKGGKESDTTEQLILQAVGQAPGSRLGAASTMWGGGWTPSRPPSQVWLQGPAGPRSAAPGKVECGRCEGVTPDGERHPEITVPPHTPDGGLLPTPAGAPGTSAPIAALGRLLLRVQYLGAVGEDAGGVQHDALLGLGVEDLEEWKADARGQRLRPALSIAKFPPPHLNSKLPPPGSSP